MASWPLYFLYTYWLIDAFHLECFNLCGWHISWTPPPPQNLSKVKHPKTHSFWIRFLEAVLELLTLAMSDPAMWVWKWRSQSLPECPHSSRGCSGTHVAPLELCGSSRSCKLPTVHANDPSAHLHGKRDDDTFARWCTSHANAQCQR